MINKTFALKVEVCALLSSRLRSNGLSARFQKQSAHSQHASSPVGVRSGCLHPSSAFSHRPSYARGTQNHSTPDPANHRRAPAACDTVINCFFNQSLCTVPISAAGASILITRADVCTLPSLPRTAMLTRSGFQDLAMRKGIRSSH